MSDEDLYRDLREARLELAEATLHGYATPIVHDREARVVALEVQLSQREEQAEEQAMAQINDVESSPGEAIREAQAKYSRLYAQYPSVDAADLAAARAELASRVNAFERSAADTEVPKMRMRL